MEYGILLYRSEQSLKRFRASVLTEEESPELEEAFLKQDCCFLTFEGTNEDEDEDEDEIIDLAELPLSEIEPSFGNIHPLEGLRSVLYEEEERSLHHRSLIALSTISVANWLGKLPSLEPSLSHSTSVSKKKSKLLSPSLQCLS